MSGLLSVEAREEWRALLRRALSDDALLDRIAFNFSATIGGETPMLAAYQRLHRSIENRLTLRAAYDKRKDVPDGRWWPDIVAGCVWLYRDYHGHMPRQKLMREVIADVLEIPEDEADLLYRWTWNNARFHRRWSEIASDRPGLLDDLAAQRARR